MTQISEAVTRDQLEAVRDLMRAFVDWQHQRHHQYRALLDSYFDPVKFEAELSKLPGEFAAPGGRLLLASIDGRVAGCIALRDLGDGVCEMKRLFIYPEFHGRGIGRLLAQRVIEDAADIGYRIIRLDTGPGQYEAQGLYKRLGFRFIEPYYELENDMRNWLVFMERALP